MAESEGFEPPIALRRCLISSQVHSTGLCQLSALYCFLSTTYTRSDCSPLQSKYAVSVVVPVAIYETGTNLSTAAALCAGARCEYLIVIDSDL